MVTPPPHSLEDLRRAGLDALRRELGEVGMVRFIQQFHPGTGDYTAERWQWLPDPLGVAALAAQINDEADHGQGEKTPDSGT